LSIDFSFFTAQRDPKIFPHPTLQFHFYSLIPGRDKHPLSSLLQEGIQGRSNLKRTIGRGGIGALASHYGSGRSGPPHISAGLLYDALYSSHQQPPA